MTDPKTIADTTLASWNAAPADRLSTLASWRPDATYIDPLMSGTGRDSIALMMDRAMAQFPGHHFALDGTPDGHGNFVRFAWALKPKAGPAVARGTDVVRLDAEGQIAEVIGFLDGGAA